MKRTILIAPNSFKECLDSVRTTELIYDNIHNHLQDFNLIKLPLSDGGDGFINSLKHSRRQFIEKHYIIRNIAGELLPVPVIISEKILFIESAQIIGLNLLPINKRNPLHLNTNALGDLLYKINEENKNGTIEIEKVIIGIGGTATNDLGLGVCSTFGLKLLDKNDNLLDIFPLEYHKVRKILWDEKELTFTLDIVIDVINPLLGEMGAANVFAPQKGADAAEVRILENGIINILNVIEHQKNPKFVENLPGAGGGLAAGLVMFLKANIITSELFIQEDLNAKKYQDKIDYLITGEGSLDIQSFLGKTPGILLKMFHNSRIFFICGFKKNNFTDFPENVHIIELIKYFRNKDESIRHFESGIKFACEEILKEIELHI